MPKILRSLFATLAIAALFSVVANAEETPVKSDVANCPTAVAPTTPSGPVATGPSPWALVGAGLPMAVVEYFASDALHESMHCLSVELVGGKCLSLSVLPSRNANGTLVLGYTQWSGNLSKSQETFVLLAPKMMDMALMGTYATLYETHSLPNNKYGQLAMAIVGLGADIDFAKHFVIRTPDNDVERAYTLNGIHGAGRAPYEIFYAATIIAGGIEPVRGLIKVFSKTPSRKDDGKRYLTKYGSPIIGAGSVGWAGEF